MKNMINRFDTVKHLYYIDGKPLKSVTKLIGQYQRPFNAPMVAHMAAKGKNNKEGWTASDYLTIWDLKRDIAIHYGQAIHMTIEMWMKFKIKPTQGHLKFALESFLEKYGDDYISEKRVFNAEFELGGTIDLINDEFLDDIKTNDTMKVEKKGNFIKPLNKVKVNNLNKATIQLNIYENLEGEKKKKRVLNFNGFEWTTIPLDDIDVSEILELRKKEL